MTISVVPPAARAADDARWVPVLTRYYETPIQASVDRAVLEEAGIPTVLQDGEAISMDWALHRALGGTKIAVPADRLAEAEELLGAAPEIPFVGEADWLSEDEQRATRMQLLGLISLMFFPLVAYFWLELAEFRKTYREPSATARQRVRRGTWLAVIATVFGFTMIFIMLTW